MNNKQIIVQYDNDFHLVKIALNNEKIKDYEITKIQSLEDDEFAKVPTYLLYNYKHTRIYKNVPNNILKLKNINAYLIQDIVGLEKKDNYTLLYNYSLKQRNSNEKSLICNLIENNSFSPILESLENHNLTIDSLINTEFSLFNFVNSYLKNPNSIYIFSNKRHIDIFFENKETLEFYKRIDFESLEMTKQNIQDTLNIIETNYKNVLEKKVILLNEVNEELLLDYCKNNEYEIEKFDILDITLGDKSISKHEKNILLLALGTYISKDSYLNILKKKTKLHNKINLFLNIYIAIALVVASYFSFLFYEEYMKINELENYKQELKQSINKKLAKKNQLLNLNQIEFLNSVIEKDKQKTFDKINYVLEQSQNIFDIASVKTIDLSKDFYFKVSFIKNGNDINELNEMKKELETLFYEFFYSYTSKIDFKINLNNLTLEVITSHNLKSIRL